MSELKVKSGSLIYWEDQVNYLIELLDKNAYSKIFILCDQKSEVFCLPVLLEKLPQLKGRAEVFSIPEGERYKQLPTAEELWKSLHLAEADRFSLLINLGGGVITDLGGLVASLYKRGIDFIHIPTTLLAMIDAAIGGKNGVDLQELKNQLGTFNPAKAVLIDPSYLASLEAEELKNGMAEVLKHALIADASLMGDIKTSLKTSQIDPVLIRKAAQIKVDIVDHDPFEKGERKLLNFGHTIGHAIESHFLNQKKPIKHGFAIAAGMLCEAYISESKQLLSSSDLEQLKEVILDHFPKIEWTPIDDDLIAHYCKFDKKNRAGKIQMVLLEKPGKASFDHQVELEAIKAALAFYRSL